MDWILVLRQLLVEFNLKGQKICCPQQIWIHIFKTNTSESSKLDFTPSTKIMSFLEPKSVRPITGYTTAVQSLKSCYNSEKEMLQTIWSSIDLRERTPDSSKV
jgi:hypothetical protein